MVRPRFFGIWYLGGFRGLWGSTLLCRLCSCSPYSSLNVVSSLHSLLLWLVWIVNLICLMVWLFHSFGIYLLVLGCYVFSFVWCCLHLFGWLGYAHFLRIKSLVLLVLFVFKLAWVCPLLCFSFPWASTRIESVCICSYLLIAEGVHLVGWGLYILFVNCAWTTLFGLFL